MRYDFIISGVRLRVVSPRDLTISGGLTPFLNTQDFEGAPDICVEVSFGGDRKNYAEPCIVKKYYAGRGNYVDRIEPLIPGEPWRLWVPEEVADDFCTRINWLNFLALERMLILYKRAFLHASGVIYDGRAYLFSAPSGVGKSTQAALWEKYAGAQIINGDKILLSLPQTPEGEITAHGSPIAGTSGIYRNISAPVGAIFVISRGDESEILPISAKDSLFALYSQSVKSDWDAVYNTALLDVLREITINVPIFKLKCAIGRSAMDRVLESIIN